MDKNELWQAVLAQIQLNISPANFATWFKDTKIINIENGEVTVSTPNSFAKEWLEQKHNKIILKILHGLDETIKSIKYIVEKPALRVSTKTFTVPYNNQLEFAEFKINKETGLNSRYTFENFVVGPFNELPHAAALAVSESPGSVYNPLFIYGGVGLGKTHLLQAIGNEIVKNFSKKKVKYISAEKFTSGVIASIKNREMEVFKSYYQQTDVLIIDDIQFLAGKEKTQEEFFHIFNALYEKNKQIIISSDRPPKVIPALTERLRSRFEGGMLADISIPDFETRVAILKSKTKEKGVDFSDEILNYIASQIQKNIRELEGALNRLIVYQKIQNKYPDIETAKTLLKNILISPPKVATPSKVIKEVALFYNVNEKDLLHNCRKKEIVYPRQIAMFLLRNELKCSYPFIGRIFKGKDHTTAMYSFEKISKEIEKNERVADEIALLKEKVYEY
jgi:chromosomal replication initiator protein